MEEKIEKGKALQKNLSTNQPQEQLSEKYIYQLGLWLDNYDDIFSDFDPRPYSKRQLSDDFLIEIKKRVKESPKGEYELAFYIQKEKREQKTESLIKKRLKDYFDFELKNMEEKVKEKDRKWGFYFITGLFILFLSAFFSSEFQKEKILVLFANLILPVGWFSVWSALDYFLNQKKDEVEKLAFFQKMKNCNYRFEDFEVIKEQLEESKQKVMFMQKVL
ncbi:MAG: hypothetical protein ACK4J0_01650 [Candidatus Anstonellaceae archaeon]